MLSIFCCVLRMSGKMMVGAGIGFGRTAWSSIDCVARCCACFVYFYFASFRYYTISNKALVGGLQFSCFSVRSEVVDAAMEK